MSDTEPMKVDIEAWLAALDRFAEVPFMEDGRDQPPMPEPEDIFA
jgi:antitoxin VapB